MKTYRCNNSFYKPPYEYNMGAIIDESTYKKLPELYKKWFTDVDKPLDFFCQKITGDEDFSIEEWNNTFLALNKAGASESEMNKILHPELEGCCPEQCFACMAIVGAKRKQTQERIALRESAKIVS